MKWSNLFNSFVPQRKSNPLLGVLSAVGSVGSSLFSQESQQQENQKNRDFTLEMWNRQNEYNSPKHQAELLREGGYNPYILSNQGTGSLAQTPSSPSSSPLPAMQNPVAPLASVFQQGLQIQSNIELQHAEAQEKLYSTIIKAYQEGGKDFGDKAMEQLAPAIERLDFVNSPLGRRLDAYIKNLELQNVNVDLDNKFKDLENKWYDILSSDSHNLNQDTHQLNQDLHKQYVQTLAKIKAEIKEINSRTDLNKQQKENLTAEKVGIIISNGISGLDFQNKQTMQKDIQGIIHETLSNLEEDTGLKSAQNVYFHESGKTQKHHRKHSKTQAGPFVFEYQGYD